MNLNRKNFATTLQGEAISLEISELAHQANAAVIGKHGETVVLATVVMGSSETSLPYFPLTVDYEERFYAAGKIIGSRFIRREGKPSDEATLSARLIDRTIRPLFDQRLRRDIQVTVTVLAYDGTHDPDTIALLATSTALSISNIPWNGPVAGVALKETAGDGTLNHQSFFAGTEDKINMIELEGRELDEKSVVALFETAQNAIRPLIAFQLDIQKAIGKPKADVAFAEPKPELVQAINQFLREKLPAAVREKTLNDLKKSLFEHLIASNYSSDDLKTVDGLFEHAVDTFVHREAIDRGARPDGRKLDEVRDLYGEITLFERTHGSGLFVRGDTQILAVTTLAAPSAEQLVETMETTGKKRFMLHYNFPNFSVGEVGRSRGPGRREIGHGTLAAKAIQNLIPSKEVFPYAIRVVAETLSSNGSSSMASACATSLSLMDAGVPMPKHVAGIAMGLMSDANGNHKVLTDIQGPEDHHGDMDCKIAGTRDGITAIQMDVKIDGITKAVFEEALAGARAARFHILDVMEKVIAKPREHVSQHAPTIRTLRINPDKIGLLIGPGGKTINGIIAAHEGKITIDIEQEGLVYIAGTDVALVERGFRTVEQIVHEYKVGDIVEGPVVRVLDFGAIVDLGGDRDGMIHVSELKNGFVKNVEEVVHLGDHVTAKVIRVEENGKIGLSLKALTEPGA